MSDHQGTFLIRNSRGLHARAAAQFVKVANDFAADITVVRGPTQANGKSIMSLLILAAPKGAEIEVRTAGADAADALRALGALVASGFGESS